MVYGITTGAVVLIMIAASAFRLLWHLVAAERARHRLMEQLMHRNQVALQQQVAVARGQAGCRAVAEAEQVIADSIRKIRTRGGSTDE